MRFVRRCRARDGSAGSRAWRALGALLTAAALSGAAGCADAVANSASVWVSVSPATVSPGFQTQVTASCGENVNSATVSSTAFGSQPVQPTGGVLATTATVTRETAPGTYGVRLACPTGSQATTTLTVIGGGGGSKGATVPGPDTGGGFLADHDDPADLDDAAGRDDAADRDDADQASADQASADQASADQASADQASAAAGRTPLVWLGAGLGCLLLAAGVAVQARRRAAVRSHRTSGPR